MFAGVSDCAHRFGIAFEARPEGPNEMAGAGRVDVIALLARLLPTAGLVPEEVGDYQFPRAAMRSDRSGHRPVASSYAV